MRRKSVSNHTGVSVWAREKGTPRRLLTLAAKFKSRNSGDR